MYYIRINGECACVSKIALLALGWDGKQHYQKASDATPDLDKIRKEFPGAKTEIVIGECPVSRKDVNHEN